MSKRNKKHKNKNRWRKNNGVWQQLKYTVVAEDIAVVDKEEINKIAVLVFGGLNVSSKDL